MRKISLLCVLALTLAACGPTAEVIDVTATATLAPIVSHTPRFTATPRATSTPLPTFTLTPSETPIPPTPSDTPTPTDVPPIIGIIASMATVNIREGPGTTFAAFVALAPGTRVEVLGQNPDGTWLNIQMEDGRQGWVAATLIRLQETPTPLPTATPSPDLTALALGTPLPTAVLGGGTVTPTPPPAAVTPTPITATSEAREVAAEASPSQPLPVINIDSINQTATALAGGIIAPTPTPTNSPLNTPIPPGTTATLGPASTATLEGGLGQAGSASAQQGVDVLAYCNDLTFGVPAPTNLAAGSTIDIFWGWYARTEAQVRDHIDTAIYEVAINGVRLQNWAPYRTSIRLERDNNYHVYWFVPAGPLAAGEYEITYRLSWTRAISDGYADFGPGTANPIQTGNCRFTVRP